MPVFDIDSINSSLLQFDQISGKNHHESAMCSRAGDAYGNGGFVAQFGQGLQLGLDLVKTVANDQQQAELDVSSLRTDELAKIWPVRHNALHRFIFLRKPP